MKDELGDRDLTETDAVALGNRFVASLTDADREACPFHAADWRSIADESVRILEGSSSRTREALAAAAAESGLPPAERRWLESLFRVPVVVHEHSYGDGQHRGCALRFSGAQYPEDGGGAIIASRYVRRARSWRKPCRNPRARCRPSWEW
jgi:hypothetical protein